MCLSAVPWSASQITLAQRQSYNKTRPLNHISTAFYRPTPQLRHYETVDHTEMCVSECVWGRDSVCVCVCVWDCLGGDACVFYQTLLAFELLGAASDSVSSSPFIRSASRRCHLSFPCAYITRAPRARTSPGDHWLTSSARTFWLVSWFLFHQAPRYRERASRTIYHLKIIVWICKLDGWVIEVIHMNGFVSSADL